MAVPALVKQYEGQHTDALVQGRIFHGVSAVAGLALITTVTTGGHPTLWNPAGSGVNVSILGVEFSIKDGTNAFGSLGWYLTSGAGSAIATGGPIATFTKVAPIPGLAGGPYTSKVYWAPTTNTFTTAPAYYAPIPLNLWPVTVGAVVVGTVWRYPCDGKIGIAPGTALSICSIESTTTSKFILDVAWEEIPV